MKKNNKIYGSFSRIFSVFIILILAAVIISAVHHRINQSQKPTSESMSFHSIYDEYIKKSIDKMTETDSEAETYVNGADNDSSNNINASDTIKVLISNDGKYYHDNVRLTCDTDFSVTYGDKTVCYGAGDVVDVESDIVIEPNQPEGKIQVLNIEKNGETPAYRGRIYITAYGNAEQPSYTIINELPLEEYLYSVVSSEMPSSFDKEALKAQAVCARGFAIRKINEGAYAEYGADIDDTTSCQVYNNIAETEESINAVNETSGMVAEYDGEIIESYFYSTSCGTTCSNDEVWAGESLPYLVDSLEVYADSINTNSDIEKNVMSYNNSRLLSAQEISLSSESAFQDFIDNRLYTDTVEQKLPMYRWTVEYTSEQMAETVNTALKKIITSNAGHIEAFYKDNESNVSDITSLLQNDTLATYLDDIENISVTSRGNSGIALTVTIYCSNIDITVSSQYLIRQLFSPELTDIITQTGSSLTGWTMLPSAYFYIEKNEAGGYTISGGGFGHGVGMSQNGANQLAAAGYGYKDILQYYFPGIEVEEKTSLQ